MRRTNKRFNGRALAGFCCVLVMVTATVLLLSGHSAMGFSDPNHWVHRAVSLFEGDPKLRRVILFPVYVGVILRLLGSALVFLCNLPFVLLLILMCGWLTLRLVSFRRELDAGWKALAFVCGAGGLVYFQSARMSVMLNPYRDAPGMALCLLGWWLFLLGDETKSKARGFAAGLLCALSLGFRETMFLAFLPVGIWVLVRLCREIRNRRVWAWTGMMVLGGIVGLSPTLYQNHLYSGYFFIPAYSASHIVEQAEEATVEDPHTDQKDMNENENSGDLAVLRSQAEQRWMADRPTRLRFHPSRLVPGAEPGYFNHTSRQIIRRFWRIYKGLPGIFLLVALGIAAVKRNSVVLGLILPSFILTFLFYGSYRYVNWRYVFFLHVCLIPMIAAGMVECLWGLGRLRPKWKRGLGVASLVLVTALFTGWSAKKVSAMSDSRIYAWDIPKFRALLKPHLQEPRTFIGFYHHREILSWFVDEGFNHSSFGSHLYRDTLETEGLDAALQRSADEVREVLEESHLYVHDLHHLPRYLPFWTDIEPVVDLGSLPVIAYRYEKPMNHTLYRVLPWEQTDTSFSVSLGDDSSDPAVMVLNSKRLWDDRKRERAELWVNDRKWVDRLENGVQFIHLPEDLSGDIDFRVSSDRPVSSDIPFKIWRKNRSLSIPLGMRRDWWFRDVISPEMEQLTGLRQDSVYFCAQGDFRLPVFADADHEVYAEFRVEFVCGDPALRSEALNLHAGSDPKRSMPLPQHRATSRFRVPLGTGSGGLDFRDVRLISDLPPLSEQVAMMEEARIQGLGIVKVYDIEIVSVPRSVGAGFEWIAGDRLSGIAILGGFHEPEVHLGKWGIRWSNGHARILLPATKERRSGTLRIRYFDTRPESVAGPVEMKLGGDTLSEGTHMVDPSTEMHTLSVELEQLPAGNARILEILSDAWKPSEVIHVPDFRTLGVMIHAVEWEPEIPHSVGKF